MRVCGAAAIIFYTDKGLLGLGGRSRCTAAFRARLPAFGTRETRGASLALRTFMLTLLNIAQLVLYIALLALMGQALLHLMAGARRDTNVFYRLLRLLSKPFTLPMRKLTPRVMPDAQVSWLTFLVLLVLYAVVTFERADLCVTSGQLGQAGCR